MVQVSPHRSSSALTARKRRSTRPSGQIGEAIRRDTALRLVHVIEAPAATLDRDLADAHHVPDTAWTAVGGHRQTGQSRVGSRQTRTLKPHYVSCRAPLGRMSDRKRVVDHDSQDAGCRGTQDRAAAGLPRSVGAQQPALAMASRGRQTSPVPRSAPHRAARRQLGTASDHQLRSGA